MVVDFLGHLADLHLHHSDLAYVASSGVASQVQRLREALDDHLPEVDGGGVWDRFEVSSSTAKARGFVPFVSVLCGVSRSLLPSSLIHMKLCKQGEYAKKRAFGCFVLYGASSASWWRPLSMSTKVHGMPGIWLAPLSRLHLPWCFQGKLKSGRFIVMLLQRFAVWRKLVFPDVPCTTVQPPSRQLCRDKALATEANVNRKESCDQLHNVVATLCCEEIDLLHSPRSNCVGLNPSHLAFLGDVLTLQPLSIFKR